MLKCPRCDQRLSIIAFITDLVIVRKILAHLHLPTTLSPPLPARLDAQLGFDLAPADRAFRRVDSILPRPTAHHRALTDTCAYRLGVLHDPVIAYEAPSATSIQRSAKNK